jgi:hypothetical protein
MVVIKQGDGWTVYTEPGSAWIKFKHKPDGRTLARLRGIAAWDCDAKAWRAHPDRAVALVAIGDAAETWESVGEDPPSWLDESDYPIFH